MPDERRHDQYVLRCLECGWKRVVSEHRRTEVGLRHERTQHKRRLTVWSVPMLEHASRR